MDEFFVHLRKRSYFTYDPAHVKGVIEKEEERRKTVTEPRRRETTGAGKRKGG